MKITIELTPNEINWLKKYKLELINQIDKYSIDFLNKFIEQNHELINNLISKSIIILNNGDDPYYYFSDLGNLILSNLNEEILNYG